jgi:hypothetical protein
MHVLIYISIAVLEREKRPKKEETQVATQRKKKGAKNGPITEIIDYFYSSPCRSVSDRGVFPF